MILAYFGPETMLPVASTLATIVGCALMAGRLALQFFGRGLRLPGRR